MRYEIEYLTCPLDDIGAKPFETPLKRNRFSVPWFWLAHGIAFTMKNTWEQGGRVIDTKAGAVRITWELSGTIFGDGKAHLTILPSNGARVPHRLEGHF